MRRPRLPPLRRPSASRAWDTGLERAETPNTGRAASHAAARRRIIVPRLERAWASSVDRRARHALAFRDLDGFSVRRNRIGSHSCWPTRQAVDGPSWHTERPRSVQILGDRIVQQRTPKATGGSTCSLRSGVGRNPRNRRMEGLHRSAYGLAAWSSAFRQHRHARSSEVKWANVSPQTSRIALPRRGVGYQVDRLEHSLTGDIDKATALAFTPGACSSSERLRAASGRDTYGARHSRSSRAKPRETPRTRGEEGDELPLGCILRRTCAHSQKVFE